MSIAAASAVLAPSASADAAKSDDKSSSEWDLSFHNLLDIINPLEHLPIIGTLYRAITGTHIGMPEKIAGDALYGGLWGAVSSVADAAFEKVTGKDFGETVLSLFTGHHDTQFANVTVTPRIQSAAAQPTPAPQTAPQPTPDTLALQASFTRKGIDSDLAQRAMAAYRKSISMPTLVPEPAS